MNSNERRKDIMKMLLNLREPVKGSNLAKKYNCTPAQIIIAWGVQRGIVIIPKSVHPERIKENIKSLDINISPEDMTKIASLDSHTRMTDGSAWIFPDGPYTMKNIWDEK